MPVGHIHALGESGPGAVQVRGRAVGQDARLGRMPLCHARDIHRVVVVTVADQDDASIGHVVLPHVSIDQDRVGLDRHEARPHETTGW